MPSVMWKELTAEDLRAKAAANAIVVLPVASMEQHGPHLPVGVDTFLVEAVCKGGAEIAVKDVPVVVAPTLWCGMAEHHMAFGGTFTFDIPTYQAVLRSFLKSIERLGFKRVFIVNGHGGNIAALTVAVNHYFETTGRRVFLVQWWDLAADALVDVEGPMIHAEEAETSLAIALGQRVEMDLATRDAWDRGAAVREAGFQWTSFGQYGMRHAGPKVVVPMDMLRDITESGVVGDATRASAETGERIVDAIVPRIVQVCREMAGKE